MRPKGILHRKCKCGCGGTTNPGRNFMRGHNTTKGRPQKNFPREYMTWLSMKTRCYNPNCIRWDHYGGYGIRVCIRWKVSFQAFLQDMGPKPDGLTLDRKDSERHYTPDNCRWATYSEQNRNRSYYTHR